MVLWCIFNLTLQDTIQIWEMKVNEDNCEVRGLMCFSVLRIVGATKQRER